jgi:hypothetical protein
LVSGSGVKKEGKAEKQEPQQEEAGAFRQGSGLGICRGFFVWRIDLWPRKEPTIHEPKGVFKAGALCYNVLLELLLPGR